MMSFTDILHLLFTAYLALVVIGALWGFAAFRAWGRHGYRHPPTMLEYYPPWQFAPFKVRYSQAAPRPADIAKAIALTLLPVVNVYLMAVPFILFVCAATWRSCVRLSRWLSFRVTGDANRIAEWFFRPIARR